MERSLINTGISQVKTVADALNIQYLKFLLQKVHDLDESFRLRLRLRWELK